MLEHLDACRRAGQRDANPRRLSDRGVRHGRRILEDSTGRLAWKFVQELPPHYGWALLRAATGERNRPLCHWVARVRCALAFVAWTHRRKVRGIRTWAYVVRGLGLGVFAHAVPNQNGERRSRSSLTATTHHQGVDLELDDCGHLRALARAGFFDMWQPAKDTPGLRSTDRGPSGYAFNQYWFRAARYLEAPDGSVAEAVAGGPAEPAVGLAPAEARPPPHQPALAPP